MKTRTLKAANFDEKPIEKHDVDFDNPVVEVMKAVGKATKPTPKLPTVPRFKRKLTLVELLLLYIVAVVTAILLIILFDGVYVAPAGIG